MAQVRFDPHSGFSTAARFRVVSSETQATELHLVVFPSESSGLDPVFGIPREDVRRMLDEDEAQDRALLEAVFGASIASVRDDASDD